MPLSPEGTTLQKGAPAPGRGADLPVGMAIGAYRLEAPIASGGCGTVYAGEAADGAPVAIKVLHRELLERRDALARFEREILATQRLRHSALVQIFAHGALADGRPYFVMERLTGQG